MKVILIWQNQEFANKIVIQRSDKMNKAILIGRLTRDPELKTTASGVSVCSFSIAVNRRFKNAEGNYDADFINCVAWRQQGEFIA